MKRKFRKGDVVSPKNDLQPYVIITIVENMAWVTEKETKEHERWEPLDNLLMIKLAKITLIMRAIGSVAYFFFYVGLTLTMLAADVCDWAGIDLEND